MDQGGLLDFRQWLFQKRANLGFRRDLGEGAFRPPESSEGNIRHIHENHGIGRCQTGGLRGTSRALEDYDSRKDQHAGDRQPDGYFFHGVVS